MATQSKDQSLVHREMARKAQDVHRIRNPRDTDFEIVWDGYITDVVPAGGTADVETYKVDKYLREMTDLILGEKQNRLIEEENKRREDRGEKTMEKWTGETQHVLEGKFALTEGPGSAEARMKVYKQLYVGLVKEYGMQKIDKVKREEKPTTHEQLMGKILSSEPLESNSNMPPIIETPSGSPKTPLEELKQPQLRKIAREKGIPESKTDKKAELIAKINLQG